jgi:hypothetical protein
MAQGKDFSQSAVDIRSANPKLPGNQMAGKTKVGVSLAPLFKG